MSQFFARVKLEWLSCQRGGRKQPFVGRRYETTARFAGSPVHQQFSIVLQFDNPDCPNPTEGLLGLLFVDIRLLIREGVHLDIMEGPRKVADCMVISAEPVETERAVH